jgi:predicted RNA-binding Zn ribbon-like protein
MNTDVFDLDAGALCLDFANTLEWRSNEHPKELLNDYSDLIRWGKAAGIVPLGRAKQLRQIAENQPERAAAVFEGALQLREAIYRIFSSFSEQGNVDSEDLAVLNKSLARSLSHLQIIPSAQGFAWDWTESPDGLDQVLWPATRSAGELLNSDRLDRVRQCADERGCNYLFIDTSRNRSRRWCSMDSCGNRAKARRHYKRQQKDQ